MSAGYVWLPILGYNVSEDYVLNNGLSVGYNTSDRDEILAVSQYPAKAAYFINGSYYTVCVTSKNSNNILYSYDRMSIGSNEYHYFYRNNIDYSNTDRTLYYTATGQIIKKQLKNIPIYNSINEAIDAMNDGNWTGTFAKPVDIPVNWTPPNGGGRCQRHSPSKSYKRDSFASRKGGGVR